MSEEPAILGEHNGFEIYLMPVFVTLVVDDVPGVVDWYVRALGFGVMFRGPVVHLRRSKYQDILIVQATPQRAATTGGPPISFAANGDVDAIAERARVVAPTGRAAIDGPIDTPWNARDLHVTDPGGHHLVFTSPRANPDPEDVARWKRMFDAAREA
jgi:uncharacterized glyoxalase superfamily protein PhnB